MEFIKPLDEFEEIGFFDIFEPLKDLVFLFLTIFFIFILYKIIGVFKKKELTKEQKAFLACKKIDFSDAKRAAYLISKYGYILAKDKKSKEIYEMLQKDLQKYKYKKEVPKMDQQSIDLFHHFLEVVENESNIL